MRRIQLSLLLIITFLLSSCSPVDNPVEKSTETLIRSATMPGIPATEVPAALTPSPTPTPDVFSAPVCQNEDCFQEGIRLNYLIVTRPKFLDSLVPFVEWKTENGFRVGIVTVEWLADNYQGRHLAEKMKTGIHDLRKRTGLNYVLLVGDTLMKADDFSVTNVLSSYTLANDYNVPTGFYRRGETDPPQDVLPSDAYFVEDRNWDPQNTGLNPRPDNMVSGEGTLMADVYLGRWPVREADQVTMLFEKTKMVSPVDSIFFSADTTLNDGVKTFCQTYPPSQFGKMDCYNDAFVTGRKNYFEQNSPQLNTESLFVDITDKHATTELMNKILANSGMMALLYHGNFDCVGVRNGECVSSTEFQFKNIFPLLEMEACVVSGFYLPGTSFSESMVLSPTGPVIFTQAPNPVLYLKELRDGKTAGEAFWSSASEWLYYPNPILFLGDPSIKVFVTP